MDDEKAIFRVPWIHAKKRDYNQERDAALFREWAIHSGELPTKTFQREREREREREHNRNSLYGKELPHTILHQRGHEVKDSIQINVATQNKSRATYKDKISTNFAICTVNLAQHLEVTLLIETLSPSRTRQESTETDQT